MKRQNFARTLYLVGALVLGLVVVACASNASSSTREQPRVDAGMTGHSRALWVWHVSDYLEEKGRARLLNFVRTHDINVLWCQAETLWSSGGGKATIKDEAKWRSFLTEAHASGLEVHFLDGEKRYGLEENHPKMLAQVDAVLKFNQESPKEARFDGIHHDNEVYLTQEWAQGLKPKTELIRQNLALVQKIVQRIQAVGSDLAYGVDIPFWYDVDTLDDGSAMKMSFNGIEGLPAQHYIRHCDNVGIMDYRNVALGGDGIVTHGAGEVEFASSIGQKKVLIGIETGDFKPAKITFFGSSKSYLKEQLALAYDAFKAKRGFQGVAIHYYRTFRDMKD